MRRIGRFPVNRWPQLYEINAKSQQVIDKWFNENRIMIGIMADTIERVQMVWRMLFT